jgi:hypothetical protein
VLSSTDFLTHETDLEELVFLMSEDWYRNFEWVLEFTSNILTNEISQHADNQLLENGNRVTAETSHIYQLHFQQWIMSIYIHTLCIKGLDLQTQANTSFETCRSVIRVTNIMQMAFRSG